VAAVEGEAVFLERGGVPEGLVSVDGVGNEVFLLVRLGVREQWFLDVVRCCCEWGGGFGGSVVGDGGVEAEERVGVERVERRPAAVPVVG
jgi:hypothetical protein